MLGDLVPPAAALATPLLPRARGPCRPRVATRRYCRPVVLSRNRSVCAHVPQRRSVSWGQGAQVREQRSGRRDQCVQVREQRSGAQVSARSSGRGTQVKEQKSGRGDQGAQVRARRSVCWGQGAQVRVRRSAPHSPGRSLFPCPHTPQLTCRRGSGLKPPVPWGRPHWSPTVPSLGAAALLFPQSTSLSRSPWRAGLCLWFDSGPAGAWAELAPAADWALRVGPPPR